MISRLRPIAAASGSVPRWQPVSHCRYRRLKRLLCQPPPCLRSGSKTVSQASHGIACYGAFRDRHPGPLKEGAWQRLQPFLPRNRVVQVRRFRGPEELDIVDAPLPTAGRGEVRVRVLASGVEYTDVVIRRHLYPQTMLRRPPSRGGRSRGQSSSCARTSRRDATGCRLSAGRAPLPSMPRPRPERSPSARSLPCRRPTRCLRWLLGHRPDRQSLWRMRFLILQSTSTTIGVVF
jgi:hypothetical protein